MIGSTFISMKGKGLVKGEFYKGLELRREGMLATGLPRLHNISIMHESHCHHRPQ